MTEPFDESFAREIVAPWPIVAGRDNGAADFAEAVVLTAAAA